jgi:hypothetical protein
MKRFSENVAATLWWSEVASVGRAGTVLKRRATLVVLSLVAIGVLTKCGGTLNGVGPSPKPNATLSAHDLSFNSQINPIQDVTLTNSGNAVLNISSITITQEFREQDNCIPSVAPGASCDIGVIFAPSTTGNFTGTLSVKDNSANGLETVSLSGVGATGDTTLTGICSGALTKLVGGCSADIANDPTGCSSGRAAITPVTESNCFGNEDLVDLSRICQAVDSRGNQMQGHCEAR